MNIDDINLEMLQKLKQVSKEIDAVCGDILRQLGIMNLTYNRFYNGDRYCMVLNAYDEVRFSQFFQKLPDRWLLSPHYDPTRKERQYIGWSFLPDDPMLSYLRSYNVWNGMSIYEDKGSYVEVFHFSTSVEKAETQNLYINDQALLDRLILLVLEKLNELTNKGGELPMFKYRDDFELELPKERPQQLIIRNVQDFYQEAELSKYSLSYKEEVHTLTKTQLDILYLIARGRTDKEIASLYRLSPRTVQSYSKVVKKKFKILSRAELIQLWEANPLLNSLYC